VPASFEPKFNFRLPDVWPGVGRRGFEPRSRADFSPQGPRSGERKDGRRNVDANEIIDGGGELGAKCRRADLAIARRSRLRLRRCRRADETIASRTRVYGVAFRHHLLRLHHNPAQHRCYPCGTHARSAKAHLLLAGVDHLRWRDVDRLRLWGDGHNPNTHASLIYGVGSHRIVSL